MENMLLTEVMTKEELIAFSLRSLYKNAGYDMFRMNKFEEYDFYAKNKDFLLSNNIITFTDTDGRLMALKPDVTLSIIKSSESSDGKPVKVYYNENVYRVSGSTKSFKEIMQAGLEFIGTISDSDVAEVIMLAAKSLDVISENYVLELSNLDIVSGVLDAYSVSGALRAEILKLLGEKNYFGIIDACARDGIPDSAAEVIGKLVTVYGAPSAIRDKLAEFSVNSDVQKEIDRLVYVLDSLENYGLSDKICVDFSVMNDMNYYNGFAFRGFIEGIPTGILSGGQYDKLMSKMRKTSGAIGFAVYLDELSKL